MKVIVKAKVPTHHNQNDLRSIGLKHYKRYGSGVHESWESFDTMRQAKEHIKSRELSEDVENLVTYLSGFDRLEFIEGKESHKIEWK